MKGKFQVLYYLPMHENYIPCRDDPEYASFPPNGWFETEQAAIKYIDDLRSSNPSARHFALQVCEVKQHYMPVTVN